MATTENEYYLRSILLLAEGGSYISKIVLYRELSGDLDTLLKSFKRKLKHELHEKQFEKLFPEHGKTVVDTWDLQMLIIVVLRLFHRSLKLEERMNLQAIKMLRHEVQAHNPSATLDDVQYDNIKVQLTNALTSLASGFDEDVQKECQSHINKYASGPLDVMSARECLKQLQENDAMFKQVLEKVEKSNNDICACVNATKTVVSQQITDLEKLLIERLERLDMGTCRKKIKVGMHVELALGGPTEEWILLMERTLNDIFNEAYKTSGEKFEDMKKTVEELLEDIKQNTTISFKGSKTKCIILMFECFTFAGLLDFLQYVTSQKYRDRLDALTVALSAHFRVDVPVTVTSKITAACLQNAIDILVEPDEKKREADNCQSHPIDEYKKSLRLAMECSSAEDLVYLWKMFQQGGAKHYLDRITDMLSEHSGQRITLTSSIDLEEFKEAIEETVGSTVDVVRGTSKTTGKQTTEDSMKDIRKDVEEKYDADHFRFEIAPSGSGSTIDIVRRASKTTGKQTVGSTVDVVRGTSKTTGKQTTEDSMKDIRKDVEEKYDADHFRFEIAPSGSGSTVDIVRRTSKTTGKQTGGSVVRDIRGPSKTTKDSMKDIHKDVREDYDADYVKLRKMAISSSGIGDAMDVGKTVICFYGDDYRDKAGQKPFVKLEELAQSESAFEDIRRVFVYKYPQTPVWFLNYWWYHMVTVFETQKWWWSIEKSSEGITLQRSKKGKDLLKQYRNTSRKYGSILEKSTKGYSSVADLINRLNKTGELERDYNIMTSNCTTFAKVVVDNVTVPRSPQAKTPLLARNICRQQ